MPSNIFERWPDLGKFVDFEFRDGDIVKWVARRNLYTTKGKIVDSNPPGKKGFVKVILFYANADTSRRIYIPKEKIFYVAPRDQPLSYTDFGN